MRISDWSSDVYSSDLKTHLAAHEYPREVAFVYALPLTATGKVIRQALREQNPDCPRASRIPLRGLLSMRSIYYLTLRNDPHDRVSKGKASDPTVASGHARRYRHGAQTQRASSRERVGKYVSTTVAD